MSLFLITWCSYVVYSVKKSYFNNFEALKSLDFNLSKNSPEFLIDPKRFIPSHS